MEPFEVPSCEAPLLQGDIIQWHRPRENSPGEMSAIVINADCDIFNDKAGAFLTYIPLLSLNEYMNKIWVSQVIGDMMSKKVAEIADFLGADVLSVDAIRELAVSEDREAKILGILSGEPSKVAQLTKLLDHFEWILKAQFAGAGKSFFNTLCDLRSKIYESKALDVSVSMQKQFRAHLNDRNQYDCFFLSKIPASEDRGFVASIRYFRTIPADQIVKSKGEWYSADTKALRIGRLKPVLKYALSQKFSSLFLRIGLPKEYENAQKTIVAEFTSMEAI